MKRKLNLKFLGCTLAGAVILFTSVHFLHAYQVRRKADTLLAAADQEEQQGDLDQAADHLDRYLELTQREVDSPTRIRAQARYGLLVDQLAIKKKNFKMRGEAFYAMQRALARDPGNRTLALQLARNAIDLRQFGDAQDYITRLIEPPPEDGAELGELESLMARCHAAKHENDQAAAWYAKAIEHAPQFVPAYASLAMLQEGELHEPKKADDTLAALLKANPESLAAALAHGAFYLRHARAAASSGNKAELTAALDRVSRDVALATRLAPDDIAVSLMAGEFAEFTGKRDQARQELERAVAKHPTEPRIYVAWAALERSARRPEDGVACLRKGLAAIPDQPELLWSLADVLLDLNPPAAHVKEAGELIRRLGELGAAAGPLSFLQARMAARENKWTEAIALLDEAKPRLEPWPELVKQSSLLLGMCQEKVGNTPEALEAYRRAVALEPSWLPACLGLAREQAALGRYDDAIATFRRVYAVDPQARILAARMIVLRNLSLPQSQRKWDELDSLLDEAGRQFPNSVDVVLLRADRLASTPAGMKQAIDLVAKARDARPEQPRLWTALAALTQREPDGADKALQILEEAKKRLGDRAVVRMALAESWSMRGGPEARTALTKISEDRERFPAGERERLLDVLATSFLRLGDRPAAQQLWRELAALEPNNRDLRLLLLELAMQANDESAIQRVLQDLQSTEGSDGTTGLYAKICYLIWRAGAGHGEALDEARSLLGTLTTRRPDWYRVPICEGRIRELENKPDEAIRCYQRAIALGDRDITVMQRVVKMLHDRQQFAEADEVARLLPETSFNDHEMQRALVDIALGVGDVPRALGAAERMVARNTSRNFRDYLIYAQLLWQSEGRSREAEAAIKKAIELEPKQPDAWAALVRYLTLSGRSADALAALHEAQGKVAPEQVEWMLAQGYAAMKNIAEARKHYDKVVAARGDDMAVLRDAAEFYANVRRPAECEKCLRRLIAISKPGSAEDAWTRRMLGMLLAAGGNPRDADEVKDLVSLQAVKPNDTVDDRRAKAYVLASRNDRRARQQAVAILEEMGGRWRLTLEDRYVLARLHETVGAWEKARREMAGIPTANETSIPRLAACARALLAHHEVADVVPFLERIRKLDPADPVVTEIEARLAKARGDGATAVKTLEAFVGSDSDRAGQAAQLLEELGELPAAEAMYRRFAADPRPPERILALAEFLGRHQRLSEALQLCERSWDTCKAERVLASTLAILMMAGSDGTHASLDLEKRIQQTLQKKPQDAAALLALATLRQTQQRYPEAIDILRQAVEVLRAARQADAQNASVRSNLTVAVNNLAWLLAFQHEPDKDALALSNEAIQLSGQAPALLDTRAVVEMALGQTAAAIDDLQNATLDRATPSTCFHLARAYLLSQNRNGAIEFWQRAKSLGLKPETIDPLELPAYRELAATLDTK